MTTTTTGAVASGAPAASTHRIAAAVAGSLGAAVAMAVAELLAGLLAGAPSLVTTIGDLVISLQPPGAKQVVVDLFGTADKLVLIFVIVAAALVIAGIAGILGLRHPTAAAAIFVIVGAVAALAALSSPLNTQVLVILTVVVSTLAGIATMRWLTGFILRPAPGPSGRAGMPDWSRRSFLIASGGTAVGATAIGLLGRRLLDQPSATAASSGDVPGLPPPAEAAAPLSPDTSLGLAGITPIVVPTNAFYRIDTALVLPRVDAATWRLKIHGLVDRAVELTYADLLRLPLFEQYVTIACVSNEVGGNLVGNAKWTGVHLRALLEMAGPAPAATQIVGRSVDGWTAGFPTAHAMDPARDPMVAVAMNDAPLPVAHGYPARLIIPGLYGYVSATKWLSAIELTTWEAFDGYWIPKGWAKEGPILTQSRIDVANRGSQPGSMTLGGVAWAPDRGVGRVEVQVDDLPWAPARISAPISKATWVQWAFDIIGLPGDHVAHVRAVDGTGAVQDAGPSEPAPDGARGYHAIRVSIP